MYIYPVLWHPGKFPELFSAPRIPPHAFGCLGVLICSTLLGFPGCPRKADDQPLGPESRLCREGRRKDVCLL